MRKMRSEFIKFSRSKEKNDFYLNFPEKESNSRFKIQKKKQKHNNKTQT